MWFDKEFLSPEIFFNSELKTNSLKISGKKILPENIALIFDKLFLSLVISKSSFLFSLQKIIFSLGILFKQFKFNSISPLSLPFNKHGKMVYY